MGTEDDLTSDQGLALLGLAATIFFGAIALIGSKIYKRRQQNQRQSVGKGGFGIQSGRDTKL